MGIKLSEIKTGQKIKLLLSKDANHLEIDAVIRKHLQDNVALIKLCYESDRTLNFENVKIEVEYITEEGTPMYGAPRKSPVFRWDMFYRLQTTVFETTAETVFGLVFQLPASCLWMAEVPSRLLSAISA